MEIAQLLTRAFPVLTVVAVLLALWYVAVIPMNAQWERDQAARAGTDLLASCITVRWTRA